MRQEKIWDYFQDEGIQSFSGSVPRLRFLFWKACKILEGRTPRVLNIGAGNGWLERRCLKQGWETYALDPSEGAVQKLVQDGVSAKPGYIESIPYPDNLFDIVFCSEVLEHLSNEQLTQGLREIRRVQKDRGWLIGTVPFNENLGESEVVCPHCGERFHRWGHMQSFDKARLRTELEECKFAVVSLKTYAFPDYSTPSLPNLVRDLLRWPLGRIGSPVVYSNLLFVAHKKP